MSAAVSNPAVTVTGDVTPEEVADALKRYFSGRKIIVDREGTKKLDANSNDLLVSASSETIEDLKNLLEWKEREMKEMEASSAKALNSIQTFHQQQQALFDEFVLLRQRYDEQKLALLNILWIHCGQYHPDLRQVPNVKDIHTYPETDERVGEYTVGEMLGEGQFAMVKSCWKDDGEEYAIKIIKKERITTFTSLKRVSNEIEILRRLKSEFIVAVRDVIQTQTKLYIITEKGGADLFEFFDEHPDGVPEPWAKDIITCVLKAVLYCHDQGICHRDLKPENILLIFDYETHRCADLKLCDFGLSTRYSSKITLTDFCGSPGFFAPEMIITGQYYGDKADVWSTGCILLELVLGHERFCDVWMTAYDYEVLQSKERFTEEITETVRKLPAALSCSDPLNDFAMKFLRLNTIERPVTRTICMHPWLDGVFDNFNTQTPKAAPSTARGGMAAGGYGGLSQSNSVASLGTALGGSGGSGPISFSALSQALSGLAGPQDGLSQPASGGRRTSADVNTSGAPKGRPISPPHWGGGLTGARPSIDVRPSMKSARPSMDAGGSYMNSPATGGGGGGGGIDPQLLNARFVGLAAKEQALLDDYMQTNSDDEQPSSAGAQPQGPVHLPRIDTITPKLLNAALLKKGLETADASPSPRELANSVSAPHFFGPSGSLSSSTAPTTASKQAQHYTSPRGSRDSNTSMAAWMPTPRAPDEPFQPSGAAPRNHNFRGGRPQQQSMGSPLSSLHGGSDEGGNDDIQDEAQIEDLRNALSAGMFGGGFGGGGGGGGLGGSSSDKSLSRRPRQGSP